MTSQFTTALLSSTYSGPVYYFKQVLAFQKLLLEKEENYVKQSFRNRMEIQTSNGRLTLSIPVQHTSTEHIKIKDVCISYSEAWQRLHWRSITTAYRSSPYFEFYEDHFRPFYEKQEYDKLFDFNLALFKVVMKLLKTEASFQLTENYQAEPAGILDLRTTIDPKISRGGNIDLDSLTPYQQVFSDKLGFMPNLSIVDLLFNMGPDSKMYLETK